MFGQYNIVTISIVCNSIIDKWERAGHQKNNYIPDPVKK